LNNFFYYKDWLELKDYFMTHRPKMVNLMHHVLGSTTWASLILFWNLVEGVQRNKEIDENYQKLIPLEEYTSPCTKPHLGMQNGGFGMFIPMNFLALFVQNMA
jgi:hypothetical protein